MRLTLLYILLALLITSCGGKDNNSSNIPEENEVELGAFNLIFPENNLICTEGIDNGTEQIAIEFQWSVSENATSYELAITNQENNTTDKRTSISTSEVVNLPKGKQFSWQVKAILESKTLQSNQWNFYSVGTATENFAPFPAEIFVSNNSNDTVNISWIGSDLDDDIVSYDVFLGTDTELPLYVENTEITEINNYEIVSNTDYYIKIVTKDAIGNSSTSVTQFAF